MGSTVVNCCVRRRGGSANGGGSSVEVGGLARRHVRGPALAPLVRVGRLAAHRGELRRLAGPPALRRPQPREGARHARQRAQRLRTLRSVPRLHAPHTTLHTTHTALPVYGPAKVTTCLMERMSRIQKQ